MATADEINVPEQPDNAVENVQAQNANEDPRTKLDSLIAEGTQQYSLKNYTAASDLFAQASEIQADLNGEDSLENADLLFLYGRSLFQVGVSKSDVLGGKVAGENEDAGKKKKKPTAKSELKEEDVAAEVVTEVVKAKDGDETEPAANKPFFQFTGDENFDDSSEDEAEDGEAEGEEEDDLDAAWTILDLARVMFSKKLDAALEQSAGKNKASEESSSNKEIKERLADTHDILAEISLENESFPAAVSDFKAAIELKKELYPKESSILAEAHFKLSLALEFASTTAPKEDGQDEPVQVDEEGREEAAKEMEEAIESCVMRLKIEESEFAAQQESSTITVEGKRKVTKEGLEDVKDMINEMQQRLKDLRAPPISVSAATNTLLAPHLGGPAGAPSQSASTNVLQGILGSALGETPQEQRKRLDDAVKGANDLSGLVRKKKGVESAATAAVSASGPSTPSADDSSIAGSKRKAEDGNTTNEEKKVRIEDGVA